MSVQPTSKRQRSRKDNGPSALLDDGQEVHVGPPEVEVPLSRVAVGALEIRLEAVRLDEKQARSEEGSACAGRERVPRRAQKPKRDLPGQEGCTSLRISDWLQGQRRKLSTGEDWTRREEGSASDEAPEGPSEREGTDGQVRAEGGCCRVSVRARRLQRARAGGRAAWACTDAARLLPWSVLAGQGEGCRSLNFNGTTPPKRSSLDDAGWSFAGQAPSPDF